MRDTRLREEATRLHNAAMLYAYAYPSDPFAYVRMKRDLSLGIYDRERIVEHSEAVLAERRASVEKKFKEWKKQVKRLQEGVGAA